MEENKISIRELRAKAQLFRPFLQIGKEGISEATVASVDAYLKKNELAKLSVLSSAPLSSKEALDELARRLKAVPVQAIGRVLVLYREKEKKK